MLFSSQGLGRGGEIRTHDHLHPMQVRYQAALRPGKCGKLYQSKVTANIANNLRLLIFANKLG